MRIREKPGIHRIQGRDPSFSSKKMRWTRCRPHLSLPTRLSPEATPDAYVSSGLPIGNARMRCRWLQESRSSTLARTAARRVHGRRSAACRLWPSRCGRWSPAELRLVPLIPLRCETASVNNCARKTPALATSKTIESSAAIALFLTESRGVMAHA